MTFAENPFRVLGVTIHATRAEIVEQAQNLSFMEPEREKIIDQAQAILTSPQKRIAAEVQLFVAKDFFSTTKILPRLITVDENFAAQKPDSLLTKINKARAKSKFTQIRDADAIRNELKNIRNEIRARIQAELRDMDNDARADFANRLFAEISAKGTFGAVVEDFFDAYRTEMIPFFDEQASQVAALLPKIKINAHPKFLDELATELRSFVKARRPLDKFSIALGTNDFDDSREIFRAVRSTAIDLFNEKNLIDEPLRITRLLEENFSYLPELAAVIRKDVKFLQEAKAQQPSKNFTEALAVVESVQKAMERGLHFADGYEDANLNFYERFFKARHEGALQGLMIRRRYKPDEWQPLNLALTLIYAKMATAMTWTRRADLALELYRTALIYAEASGDKNTIAKIRDDIAELETVIPTKTFLDAMAELKAIKASMERGLHFADGFEQANLDFCENIFRPRHEFTLKRFVIRRDMRLDEWRTLNLAAAVIYAQMAAAMTWARRADLALEFYRKALPYAEASGDAKLIARVKKDVADLTEVNRQIAAQIADNSRSSGCLGVVAAVVAVLWLAL